MNKLPLIIVSVLSIGCFGALAQGTINANNSGSGVNLEVSNPTINGGAPVLAGDPATAAGFTGAGPGQIAMTLYGAKNGTALATLESSQSILATGFNSPSTIVSGIESFGNPFVLPTEPGVFDGTAQDEFIWYYSFTSGGILYASWSNEATGITPATGSGTPTIIFGTSSGLINTFGVIPIPEPSNTAIAGVSLALLLLFGLRSRWRECAKIG